jgi:prophage regulatory protein
MESSMKVLRFSKLQERVGLSRTHVGRLESAGEFPRRVALGPRSVGWREDEVDAWLEARERVGPGRRIGTGAS